MKNKAIVTGRQTQEPGLLLTQTQGADAGSNLSKSEQRKKQPNHLHPHLRKSMKSDTSFK